MPGANAKVKEIVRRLRRLTDLSREIELQELAAIHGDGFADLIRREVQKRTGKPS